MDIMWCNVTLFSSPNIFINKLTVTSYHSRERTRKSRFNVTDVIGKMWSQNLSYFTIWLCTL